MTDQTNSPGLGFPPGWRPQPGASVPPGPGASLGPYSLSGPSAPSDGPYLPPGPYSPGTYPQSGPYPQPGIFVPPAKPSPLPTTPKAYHEFYQAPAFRVWKPLVAFASFIVAVVVLGVIIILPFILFEIFTGSTAIGQSAPEVAFGGIPVTPGIFLGNNLSIVIWIPLAFLAHRLVFRQRIGYLSSIEGRFRWGLLGRFLLIGLPVYIVWFVGELAINGFPELRWEEHSMSMILIILLTTPLQCAGEEYALRGLALRGIGSYFGSRKLGWVAGTVISSVVFATVHFSTDPWLWAFYLTFAVGGCVLVWRTGGVEAAIALHIVNNLVGLSVMPFQDMAGVFDREAGVGSPWVLMQIAAMAVVVALFWWQAKKLSLATTAAPESMSAFSTPGVPIFSALAVPTSSASTENYVG